MTKEEIKKEWDIRCDYIKKSKNVNTDEIFNFFMDKLDQETERLKAELNEVKKQYSELCDVQKKLCEQNISLESELNELKKLESAKGRLSLLMLKQKAEKELNELKEKYENAIKTVKALSNENDGLKEKHKKDVEMAYGDGKKSVFSSNPEEAFMTNEQYYKQKFESND